VARAQLLGGVSLGQVVVTSLPEEREPPAELRDRLLTRDNLGTPGSSDRPGSVRLLVHADTTSVVVEELEPLLEHGSLAVRLDAVSTLQAAVGSAAVAVTPTDSAILEADPTRMDMLAQKIVGMADAMKALAATAAPNDKNAIAVLATLTELGLA